MLHLSMPRVVRLFNPELPRRVWLLQLGVLVNFFGNGLVAPFLVIYLHYGRHIPVGFAGSAVALGGITAVTSGLVAGSLADRLGSRNILVAAMVSNAAAYLLYTQVSAPWQAYVVGLLVGVGTGAYGPSSQNLTASMVAPERTAAAFAQNRVTAIIGLGAGGTVGGLIAASGLDGYIRLLVLDAITFLAFAGISLLLPSGRVPPHSVASGGYRDVLRDRPFLGLVAVNVALVAGGIAPMLGLLPAYAKGQAHVGEALIGVIYAANTLTIVIAQTPITRLVQGRGRMRMLSAGALMWVASWTMCLAAGAWLAGGAAAVVIGVAASTYALGECLYTAVMLPTATALAPPSLRGRYLGVMGFSWQTGFLIGPSVGGVLLGAFPLALPAACAAVCLAAAIGAGSVDRSLAPAVRQNPIMAAAK